MKRAMCLTLAFATLWLAAAVDSTAGAIRSAVWAGRFYPASAAELDEAITAFMRAVPQTPVPPGDAVRAVVLPHAGYVYSGPVAARGLAALPTGDIRKVVVLGPDHRVGLRSAAVSDVDAYETPLGRIMRHPDAKALLAQTGLFDYSPASDRSEHSIEVVLPYLQHRLGIFQLVPVVVGRISPERLARSIEPLLDDGTLLVVSSDLSHYLPYNEAVMRDRETLAFITGGNVTGLNDDDNRACGARPLAALVTIARHRGWRPVVLHYANSGDTAGSRNRVVGYAAIVFYGGATMSERSIPADSGPMRPEDGQALVALARRIIGQKLGVDPDAAAAEQLDRQLAAPMFQKPKGTFVTLKKGGQLRGCIGSLSARQPLKEDVADNAVNAAFRDPRFPPLSLSELADIDIEVSVLSDPEPLVYDSAEDLVRKLRPGVDGVIISRGGRRATFLPQVWEQLPTHESFLGHLCRKAGLPEKAWRDGDLEVSTYQVTYFEAPHGH